MVNDVFFRHSSSHPQHFISATENKSKMWIHPINPGLVVTVPRDDDFILPIDMYTHVENVTSGGVLQYGLTYADPDFFAIASQGQIALTTAYKITAWLHDPLYIPKYRIHVDRALMSSTVTEDKLVREKIQTIENDAATFPVAGEIPLSPGQRRLVKFIRAELRELFREMNIMTERSVQSERLHLLRDADFLAHIKPDIKTGKMGTKTAAYYDYTHERIIGRIKYNPAEFLAIYTHEFVHALAAHVFHLHPTPNGTCLHPDGVILTDDAIHELQFEGIIEALTEFTAYMLRCRIKEKYGDALNRDFFAEDIAMIDQEPNYQHLILILKTLCEKLAAYKKTTAHEEIWRLIRALFTGDKSFHDEIKKYWGLDGFTLIAEMSSSSSSAFATAENLGWHECAERILDNEI